MQIDRRDVAWSYMAQMFRFGSSLIILPKVLRQLPTDQLAIWYLYMSITGLVFLVDFGFSATIIRNITYVFGGAKKLYRQGISKEQLNEDNRIEGPLLAQVISASKLIYAGTALIALLCLSGIATYYISTVIETHRILDSRPVWISWIIIVISNTLSVYYLYINALLMGRGFIKQAQKAAIITSLSYIVIAYVGLSLGYGIVGIAIAALLSNIINRMVSLYYFRDDFIREVMREIHVTLAEKIEVVKIIWFNAKKTGMVALGGFMINRTGQFFVISYFTLELAAQYGLSMQIISITANFSIIYFGALFPKLTHDFFLSRYESVRRHMGISLILMILVFAVSALFILIWGDEILALIRSNTTLLPKPMLLAMFLINFLETQHAFMSNVLSFENKIPFVKPALISGGIIILLTFLILNYVGANIWYVILVQGLVQLCYNNWVWPYLAARKLNTTYPKIMLSGIAGIKNILFNRKA